MGWSGRLLFLFFSHAGDVASAMMWRRLRGTPPLRLAFFIASSPLYKWHIWYYSSTQRGRCFSMLTSSRHGLRLSFSLNKFYILIINLTVEFGKIQQNPRLLAPNPPLGGGVLGLGPHLGPPFLAVNWSYFALFSLITCDIGVFFM
jgi:hypothetical protein